MSATSGDEALEFVEPVEDDDERRWFRVQASLRDIAQTNGHELLAAWRHVK